MAVSVLRASRARFWLATASCTARVARLCAAAVALERAARRAALARLADARRVLSFTKFLLAHCTVLFRFLLARAAAERTAYRISRFMAPRAALEERRRSSMEAWVLLARAEIWLVIFMFMAARVFLFMVWTRFSTARACISPLWIMPRMAVLSSCLLAFCIMRSMARPFKKLDLEVRRASAASRRARRVASVIFL